MKFLTPAVPGSEISFRKTNMAAAFNLNLLPKRSPGPLRDIQDCFRKNTEGCLYFDVFNSDGSNRSNSAINLYTNNRIKPNICSNCTTLGARPFLTCCIISRFLRTTVIECTYLFATRKGSFFELYSIFLGYPQFFWVILIIVWVLDFSRSTATLFY